MFEILLAILFSIAANIDNIPIGISYGIKKIHISFFKNIFISFVTATFTFISMYISQKLNYVLNSKIPNMISASILIIIGTYPILKLLIKTKIKSTNSIKCTKKSKKNKEIYNFTNKDLTIHESILIIFTLVINNIGIGILAGITEVNIICTLFFSFAFSSLFLFIGNKLGSKIFRKLADIYSVLISSILLILLGIIELVF